MACYFIANTRRSYTISSIGIHFPLMLAESCIVEYQSIHSFACTIVSMFDYFYCEIFATIYNAYERYKDLRRTNPLKKINNKLKDLYEKSNFNN